MSGLIPIRLNPPIDLERVMQADRFRLRQRWQRLTRNGEPDPQSRDYVDWLDRASQSAQVRERREASIPQLLFDPELPITGHREELIELIKKRQTIVVCGETGSGKSTQLPKLCLEAGLGCRGFIGHTQPRRLAARAVSNRLAEELSVGGARGQNLVGYKIRFSDSTKAETLVKLMTDGVLLAETQSDRFLDQYEAIIIDEAHERSLNIDFLLGYLRRISGQRPDLKLIITSATIDPQRFAEHFADELGPAPIVEVSGRTYPVEQRYRPLDLLTSENPLDDQVALATIADAVDELMSEGAGDILIFLPTERDIRVTAKHLRGHFTRIGGERAAELLPLYARLSQAEQNKIFQSHSRRRIVLSTNVAESSLTVPGIHFVIDTGLVRISRYAPRSKVKRLPIEEVSQASANQRSGRCGRLGPGISIRLFSEDDYNHRPKFTTPEIRRSDLTSVMLQGLVLQLGPLEEFPLLDPPSAESIRDAQRTLLELGAIDQNRKLTKIGQSLGRLPCEPRVGRMLLEAAERNCLAEVLVIAAGLECQDVRQRPAGMQPQADAAHAQFQDPHSDFLSLIRLWDFFEHLRADLSRSRLERALTQNFLSHQGFREWADTVRQLKEILAEAGIRVGKRKLALPPVILESSTKQSESKKHTHKGRPEDDEDQREKIPRPDGYDAIHQSLLTGLLSGIAQRGDRHEYKGVGGLTLALWPGSGLFRRAPKWIMAAEIVETNKRYSRTVAELDVEWIEVAGASLLKHSYSDPHWSSKSGAAMVYRRSTLYGLTIASGHRVAYASIDVSAARSMMIEHGLVAGEWNCREEFYQHNQELVADIDELARRTRSREFIIDRFHLANFYNARVPEQVFDLNSLRAWLTKNRGTPAAQALQMCPEDLVSASDHLQSIEESFPNTLTIGASVLPLEYHFEPGHQRDGVTLTIPQAALRQVSEESLGWLVPGLLEPKILAIIKSLPKSLRTNFVPAPDVARKLANELAQVSRDQAFTAALSSLMSKHSGERITSNEIASVAVPEHMRFLIRVIDDEGHELASGREVQQLVADFAPLDPTLTGRSPSQASGKEQQTWVDRAVTPQDFDGLPSPITIRRGGVLVAAFPALVDLREMGKEGVEIRLADSQAEAQRLTQQGLTRLFAIKQNRSLRAQVANLPNFSRSSLQLNHLFNCKDLAQQLQDTIARMALVESLPPVLSREDFQARNAQATASISMASQEIATWLPKLAEQVHGLRLKLEQSPSMWSAVTREIQGQLDALFSPGFLATTPWMWLSEFPRYLAATQQRLEKLKNGGVAKDQKLAEPIKLAETKLREFLETPRATEMAYAEQLAHLRWMIEEFRVSIFAQQLGTKHSVSQKRIQELIRGLE
jgi:ATP-dependent helicase HrpA